MNKTPEIILRSSEAATPKLPAPQACQTQGKLELRELKAFSKPATDNHTEGHRPKDSPIATEPTIEKWTSPLLKKDPELLSKAAQFSGKKEQNLKGIVERNVVTNVNSYPWRCIGKVFAGWNNNFSSPAWTASGTLVGPNLMLTASHAAPWDKPGGWMRFVPAYNNGAEPFGSSYVKHWQGVKNSENVDGLDYVICVLYTPLGNTTGFMGAQAYGNNDDYKNRRWISVGYPGNSFNAQVPMVEPSLSIDDVDGDHDGKVLETNYLYSSPGWSGGPMWNFLAGGASDPKIVGVMSGFEDSTFLFFGEKDDVNAGGDHMVNLVKWGYQNFPST